MVTANKTVVILDSTLFEHVLEKPYMFMFPNTVASHTFAKTRIPTLSSPAVTSNHGTDDECLRNQV